MRMPPKLFGDDDGENVSKFEIDKEYGRRLEYNRKREDLQRYEELKQRGQIVDDDDESEEESEADDVVGDSKKDLKFFDSLLKVRRQDPSLKDKDVKLFPSDDEKEDGGDKKDQKKKKKKKKLYLKDVQGVEEDSDKEEKQIKSYAEEQEELRKAVSDAVEAENDEDGEELLKETEKKGDDDDDDVEEDEELVKKMDEYFGGGDGEVDENNKFMFDYFRKRMWEDNDEKGKRAVIDEAELYELEDDEDAVELQEEYESNYRHEENAGEIVMGYSRKVEGSVRKKDTARKIQRDNKDERMKMAEIEKQEELKKLKNVKKKEMKEKLKKVLLVAGFKEDDECLLNAKDMDDEFDPDEYDKMMKAVFDDKYYDEEDSGLSSDEDGEKPDFGKEDELLGLPKDWDVIQGGDGFTAAREMALKHKEIADASDDDKEEEQEEEEEEQVEGKRKRKQKISLVQRAKEALMEEYYKLDYEDTIGGDLKTRFKYAKVIPNRFDLETEEILGLEDSELNQYVPLKKIAPYREKDWEVNRHKVKEQKLKNKELLSQKKGKHDEKRNKKKRKQSDVVDVVTTKPASAAAEEGEGEGEASKLSRKAKRRRRQAEKKLPPSRMAAYGKTQ